MLEVQHISELPIKVVAMKQTLAHCPSSLPALTAVKNDVCHLEHFLPAPSPEGTVPPFLTAILVQKHLLLLGNPT